MLKRTLFPSSSSSPPRTLALAQTPDVVFERNVPMKTRDGVTLHADIYRPQGDGKYPVLLQRTPYDKNGASAFAHRAAAHGFLVVVQDVRGRYTSEGEWYPFKHETDDGYDTIEWAAALPQLQRQGRHVRRLLRRSHADACLHRPSSASRRHLPRCHRQQLPRKLDLPGRRVRAVVQRVLDLRPRAGHLQPQCPPKHQRARRQHRPAPDAIPSLQHLRHADRRRPHPHPRALLSRLGQSP